jgi:hypothetical protein
VGGMSSWEPRTNWDDALTPPEPPSILRGPEGALFYTSKRHLLWGASEALKSWIVLAAIAEVLNDGLAAVFIDADDMGQAVVWERLRDLEVPEDRIRADLFYMSPEERFDERADAIVDRLTGEKPVTLCGIDALNPALRIQGLSGLATDEVQDFIQVVVGAFHRRGVATVITDHVTKNAPVERHSFGSERKLSGVDVSISCETVGPPMTRVNPRGEVTLKAAKDRPAWHERGEGRALGTFTMDLTGSPKWSLKLGAEGVGHTLGQALAERVGQVLGHTPEVSQSECARILGVKRDSRAFRTGWAMARATLEAARAGHPPGFRDRGGPPGSALARDRGSS